jgi:thioesterase domain-containing protein/acyl carrier protein
VRAVALGAYLHQDLPFEKLVEELQPRRDPGRTPLFQVIFALQHAPEQLPDLPGLSVGALGLQSDTVKFDLALTMADEAGSLAGSFVYNADLFEAATIREMVADFQLLLEQVTLTPEQALSRLALRPEVAPYQPAAIPDSIQPSLAPGTVPAYVAPRDEREVRMVQLWEQVLGVQPVGVRDSFFDLGGHSMLAMRLFVEIERTFGRALPLATLFQSPTVELLAAALGPASEPPTWASLVAIQSEGRRPPLFCVHAVGGNVLNYRHLAHHLGPDQPVYGLQSRGLDGSEVGSVTIEEMAATYIAEMKSLCPTGPYCLAGSSFGGTVAYEMARQLVLQGDAVGLVALLDSHGPVGTAPRWGLLRRLPGHWRVLSDLDICQKIDYLKARIKSTRNRVRRGVWRLVSGFYTRASRPLPRTLQDTTMLNLQALKRYRPSPHPGRLVLFRACLQGVTLNSDPLMGWGDLAQDGVEVVEVPGDHISMLEEPNVSVLAERLGILLRNVSIAGGAAT